MQKNNDLTARMQKTKNRFLTFGITTIVCALCGLWVFLLAKTDRLYRTDMSAFPLNLAVLLLPFALSIAITRLYRATIELVEWDIPLWLITLLSAIACGALTYFDAIDKFLPQFLHMEVKTFTVVMFALPIAVTYAFSVYFIFHRHRSSKLYSLVEKPLIRVLSVMLLTAIFGGCGFLVYALTQSGQLLKTDNAAFWLNLTVFLLPLAASIAAAVLYGATVVTSTSDFHVWQIFLLLIFIFRFLLTTEAVVSLTETLIGADTKWIIMLQYLIPLAVTYLLCGFFMVYVPKEKEIVVPPDWTEVDRVTEHIKASYNISPSTTTESENDSADSKGLASGRGY